jgi:SagB-type dehydrogenase family enzyme
MLEEPHNRFLVEWGIPNERFLLDGRFLLGRFMMKGVRVFAFSLATVVLISIAAYCQKAADSGSDDQARSRLTLGQRFHAETCLTSTGFVVDRSTSKPAMPERFKRYDGAKMTQLPKPDYRGLTVEEAMSKRHSVRQYKPEPLSLSQLSQLLFSAQGVTTGRGGQPARTAPSAGALYPFEVYVVASRVNGLPKGLYHYAAGEHGLELVREGDLHEQTMKAGLSQESLGDAAAVIVLTAVFDRTCSKYGERGFRYVYIEAGHIAQNLCLEVVSLGLGSVTVGAFIDEEVNRLIGIDGMTEAAIYLHPVGVI